MVAAACHGTHIHGNGDALMVPTRVAALATAALATEGSRQAEAAFQGPWLGFTANCKLLGFTVNPTKTGHGDAESQRLPKQIAALAHERVVAVDTGWGGPFTDGDSEWEALKLWVE